MENRLIYRKSGSPETQSEKSEFKGDEINIRSETKPFEGDGIKLIDVYQEEIEHVNREYIQPLEQKIAANEHWLSRIKGNK